MYTYHIYVCMYIYIYTYTINIYHIYILYQWIFIAIITIIVVVPLLQRLYDLIWQVMGHKPLPIPSPNIKLPMFTYLTPAAPQKTYCWLYTSYKSHWYAHSQCVTVLLIIPLTSNGIRVFLLVIPMKKSEDVPWYSHRFVCNPHLIPKPPC